MLLVILGMVSTSCEHGPPKLTPTSYLIDDKNGYYFEATNEDSGEFYIRPKNEMVGGTCFDIDDSAELKRFLIRAREAQELKNKGN
jgi:hypothetical protein